MRLCLAGTFPSEKIVRENRPEYVLESFFYIKPWQVEEMPKWKMFLLDSGAFTFMHGVEASSKPVDWDGYLSRYKDAVDFGFYSVDSTTWTTQVNFGGLSYFNGSEMVVVRPPKGMIGADYRIRREYALKEWIKYQKYLDTKGKWRG